MENIKESILETLEQLNEEELIDIRNVLNRINNGEPAIYENLKIGDLVKCKTCGSKSKIIDTVTVVCENCGEISIDNTEEY